MSDKLSTVGQRSSLCEADGVLPSRTPNFLSNGPSTRIQRQANPRVINTRPGPETRTRERLLYGVAESVQSGTSGSRRAPRPTISISNQAPSRSETITLFSISGPVAPDWNPHQGIIPQPGHKRTKEPEPVRAHRPSAVFCCGNGRWSYRAWSLHKRPQHNHLP